MLLDFIVCDDIREEKRNKLTLVGVYSEDIQLDAGGKPQPWPILLPKLGLFIRLAPPVGFAPERYTLRVLRNTETVASVSGDFVPLTNPSKPITLVVVGSPFPLPGPGVLRFELTLHRGSEKRPVPIERTIEVKLA